MTTKAEDRLGVALGDKLEIERLDAEAGKPVTFDRVLLLNDGGKLTVRDSQMAVFVNEGQVADVFGPGLYTLSTQTLPMILGRNYTAFQGAAMISYVANGWNLTASGFYGSGGDTGDVLGLTDH